MNRFFKNEDGTFKTKNIVIVCIIISISLVCYYIYENYDKLFPTRLEISNTTRPTKEKHCNDCVVLFKQPKFTIKTNETIYVKDLIQVEGLRVSDLECFADDEKIIDVYKASSSISITSLDLLGSTKLTCKYDLKESSTEIFVEQNEYNKVSLNKNYLTIYKDKENDLDINISPINYDLSKVNLNITDQSIASFDSNMKIIGNKLGNTVLTLKDDEEIYNTKIYVVNNKMKFLLKDRNGRFNDTKGFYEYNYDIDNILEFSVEVEDNNNEGLTNDDIKIDVINVGGMKATVSYEGRNITGNNAYYYNINFDFGIIEENNYSIINFTLPDGSINPLLISLKS